MTTERNEEIAAYFTDAGREGFYEFGVEINALLIKRVGRGVFDLPDWDYSSAWEDGIEPENVVDEMLEEMGFGGEF